MSGFSDEQLKNIYPTLIIWSKNFYSDIDNQKDLVNDTVVKMIENRSKFDGTYFGGWCHRIMRNIFINNFRQSRANQNQIIDFSLLEISNQLTDTIDQIDQIDYQMDLTKIQIFINTNLCELHKNVFNLYLEGFKYDKISSTLNISIGTVKSVVHNTRKKIIIIFHQNNFKSKLIQKVRTQNIKVKRIYQNSLK